MALDKDTGSTLFGSIKKSAETKQDPVPTTQSITHTQDSTPVYQDSISTPKWQSLDKVTVLMTADQKEGLDRIAKKLMKHRSKVLKGKDDKERITANTIMRAIIENFLKHENMMELEVLTTEDDVNAWIEKLMR